jgi:hypothetical protein
MLVEVPSMTSAQAPSDDVLEPLDRPEFARAPATGARSGCAPGGASFGARALWRDQDQGRVVL